jgi:hypothetical protein
MRQYRKLSACQEAALSLMSWLAAHDPQQDSIALAPAATDSDVNVILLRRLNPSNVSQSLRTQHSHRRPQFR